MRIRILVVDDFLAFRAEIRSILEAERNLVEITEAADGLEAVQKAEELRPDLILLDIGLPAMDGIQAARKMRELVPESKIIFVSQETSADVVEAAMNTGASGYVKKAQSRTDLMKAIGAALRNERFVSGGLGYSLDTQAH